MNLDQVILGIGLTSCLLAFLNGWNDAPQALMSTFSTKVLSPKHTILLATFGNTCGALWGFEVANAIATAMIQLPTTHAAGHIWIALMSPIIWILVANRMNFPVSSTHSLAGSLFGLSFLDHGFVGFKSAGAWNFAKGLIIAPTLALVLGFFAMVGTIWVLKNYSHRSSSPAMTKAHIIATCCLTILHGSSDAQKATGIILMASLAAGVVFDHQWIIYIAIAIGLGTFLGGLRMFYLRRVPQLDISISQGAVAQMVASILIGIGTMYGVAVSTTQIITSALYGSAFTEHRRYVGYGLLQKIVIAWLITLPFCAFLTWLILFSLRSAGLL